MTGALERNSAVEMDALHRPRNACDVTLFSSQEGRAGRRPRHGTARSLSSGRALRGPVGAFTQPTLADEPTAAAPANPSTEETMSQ